MSLKGGALHDELPQLRACLAWQSADASLRRGGDFVERQVRLRLLLAFFRLLVESADCLFAADLVSLLLFIAMLLLERTKHHSEPDGSGRRVATFHELSDILRPSCAIQLLKLTV